MWFQQYMTLLLWSTKKELWVIFCLRPGSDEKYSCEFLQMGTWQGFIYEGGNGCNISRKRIFLQKPSSKIWYTSCSIQDICVLNMMLPSGVFFLPSPSLSGWLAEVLKRRCIWRTPDVKSLKLTMSVFAIIFSNIRKLPWRNQTLDKKEEQTKSKDWCKESCKPGQRGRQSEGGWGKEATPGHEEEKSLQGQLVSSIILIHVLRILWRWSKVCLHHLIAEAALCTIPLPGKSLMDNRESFALHLLASMPYTLPRPSFQW